MAGGRWLQSSLPLLIKCRVNPKNTGGDSPADDLLGVNNAASRLIAKSCGVAFPPARAMSRPRKQGRVEFSAPV